MTVIQWECNITIARWMLDEGMNPLTVRENSPT